MAQILPIKFQELFQVNLVFFITTLVYFSFFSTSTTHGFVFSFLLMFPTRIQLSSLGLPPESFNIASCTLQSDKFICVRDNSKQPSQVAIVSFDDPANPNRFPLAGDSAVMNPSQPVIAVRGVASIQKKKKNHTLYRFYQLLFTSSHVSLPLQSIHPK